MRPSSQGPQRLTGSIALPSLVQDPCFVKLSRTRPLLASLCGIDSWDPVVDVSQVLQTKLEQLRAFWRSAREWDLDKTNLMRVLDKRHLQELVLSSRIVVAVVSRVGLEDLKLSRLSVRGLSSVKDLNRLPPNSSFLGAHGKARLSCGSWSGVSVSCRISVSGLVGQSRASDCARFSVFL